MWWIVFVILAFFLTLKFEPVLFWVGVVIFTVLMALLIIMTVREKRKKRGENYNKIQGKAEKPAQEKWNTQHFEKNMEITEKKDIEKLVEKEKQYRDQYIKYKKTEEAAMKQGDYETARVWRKLAEEEKIKYDDFVKKAKR